MAQYKTTAAQRAGARERGQRFRDRKRAAADNAERLATGAKPVCPHCNGQMSLTTWQLPWLWVCIPMRDPWHYGHCPYFAASIAAGDMSESGRYSLPYDNAARC